jgi:TonB family protein
VSSQEIYTDLYVGEELPVDFYTRLQFPQCSLHSKLPEMKFEDDYAGRDSDLTNMADHRILKRQSKILRDYQQQIIELKNKKEYEKLLNVSHQALAFVNDSFIFKTRFLRQYDPTLLGYFSLRGYRMDFLSALQYTTLSIVNSSLEAAKILKNEDLITKWSKTGLTINLWIHKNRGCLNKLGNRLDLSSQKNFTMTGGNLCHLNNLIESNFSETVSLAAMNSNQFDEAIHLASQSLTAVQMTPESQLAFKSAAFKRLNNLGRLAYSANQNENWCLSYEGFDRAIKLAIEVGIEPLEIWRNLKSDAHQNYLPIEADLWNIRYGMLSKGNKPLYIPVKQIPPKYPRRLLEKGVEGCVMLLFDITKEGNPKNIKVDWSTNKGFDRSAIKSAESFLFSPPYQNGKPSGVKDAQTVISYKVDSKKSRSPDYAPPGCELIL